MSIIVFGQYPRSEQLVIATRGYDRKRVGEEELLANWKRDRLALQKLQDGFTYLSSGLFHWEDLMRPFAELISNCQAGPLTRFFETNTFWRKLEVQKGAALQEEKIEEWIGKYFFPDEVFSRDAPLVFTFPFLFLFRQFSSGIDISFIQTILEKIVIGIGQRHRGLVLFLEPNIGWDPLEEEEKKAAIEFLERLKSKTELPLAIMQCFYPVGRDKEFLFSLPVDFIGIDFYCNRLIDISKGFPKGRSLLAGLISTESTILEPKEHVRKFMEETKELLPGVKVFTTASGPAELLPREVMDDKLRHMKEILWALNLF